MSTKLFYGLNAIALGAALAAVVLLGLHIYQRHLAMFRSAQVFNFASEVAAPAAVADLAAVIDAHLFGVVEKAPVVQVADAPETQLNLRLTGLVSAAGADEGSMAMIEVNQGETSVVKAGQVIAQTGATLHSVASDHILIQHRGALEKVPLERQVLATTPRDAQSQQVINALNLSEQELAALAVQTEQQIQAAEAEAAQQIQAAEVEALQLDEEQLPVEQLPLEQ